MKATLTATWIVDVGKDTAKFLKDAMETQEWDDHLMDEVFEMDWVVPETWDVELG